ncbi:hypothetical protein T03_271 [Trichinella britovi]|uniref:Uncharacterized protein n=1 Tax=Trichinella britovi TaxID=45882 RepID=A0A0V0Z088_TRIBR|nr:hypothetical protein T03_271 [Trichinella britovi]
MALDAMKCLLFSKWKSDIFDAENVSFAETGSLCFR